MLLKSGAQGGWGVEEGARRMGHPFVEYTSLKQILVVAITRLAKTGVFLQKTILRPGPQCRDINSGPLTVDSSFRGQIKENRSASIRNCSTEI